MSRKRASVRSVPPVELCSVKAFQASDPAGDILEYYRKYQVVVIKGLPVSKELNLQGIRKLYGDAKDVVCKTFSVEALKGQRGWTALTADDLFGKDDHAKGEWYASFISQISKETKANAAVRSAVTDFRNQLPVTELPVLSSASTEVRYTKPVWVFVGHNGNSSAVSTLRGRPEHVDSVDHDGTWHYQSRGSKVWYIRPAETPEWGEQVLQVGSDSAGGASNKKQKNDAAGALKEFADGLPRLKVVVEQGDVFIINTRVWWHQTRIPPTGKNDFSISYAIDFYCSDLQLPGRNKVVSSEQGKKGKGARAKDGAKRKVKASSDGSETEGSEGSESEEEEGRESDDEEASLQPYSNMDGLYASRPLNPGEVVFYEAELPDCALPRSEDPNCEIVWLEDGSGALCALKALQVGDWLTVAPSDSEDDSDSEDEDGEDGSGSEGEEEDGDCDEDCDEEDEDSEEDDEEDE